jgi:hypothetical protein
MRFPSADVVTPVANDAVQFPRSSLPYSSSFSCEFPHYAVQLRRDSQRQLGFGSFCQLRRAFEGSIQPREKIPVNEQLVAQQGGEIRKRPGEGRHQLQVTQDQHGDQRRPYLGLDGIGVCPEEGFDLQVLFDRLEEQLHLPTIPVDCCDCCSRKVEVVGQECKRALAFLVPDFDDSEEMLTVGNSLAVEVDNLILEDVGACRTILHHLEGGVVLQSGYEVNSLMCQLDEPLVINVASVHDHDRTAFESQPARDLDVTGFSVGNHGKRWQVAVMVQKQVELDGPFGPSKLSPVEQGKRQVDDAGIQAYELVLEPKLPAGAAASHTELTFCQELLKHGLVERPGAVGIGICERGAFRRNANAQVLKLAFAASQSSADLAEAMSPAKLAEQHGDELAPARKSFGCVVGTMLFHGLFEFKTGK